MIHTELLEVPACRIHHPGDEVRIRGWGTWAGIHAAVDARLAGIHIHDDLDEPRSTGAAQRRHSLGGVARRSDGGRTRRRHVLASAHASRGPDAVNAAGRPGSGRRADAGREPRSRACHDPPIRPQFPAGRGPAADAAAGLPGSERMGAAGREPRSRARHDPPIRPQFPASPVAASPNIRGSHADSHMHNS